MPSGSDVVPIEGVCYTNNSYKLAMPKRKLHQSVLDMFPLCWCPPTSLHSSQQHTLYEFFDHGSNGSTLNRGLLGHHGVQDAVDTAPWRVRALAMRKFCKNAVARRGY